MNRTTYKLLRFVSLFLPLLISGCTGGRNDNRIDLPDKTGHLNFTIRATHPFLAEFAYEATVVLNDGKHFEIPLRPQNGGHPRMLITWYPKHDGDGPFLSFDYDTSSEKIEQLFDLRDGKDFVSDEDKNALQKKLQFAKKLLPVSLGEFK